MDIIISVPELSYLLCMFFYYSLVTGANRKFILIYLILLQQYK